jgi:hypothetical protein
MAMLSNQWVKSPPSPASPRPSSDRCPPPVVAPALTRRPGEAEAEGPRFRLTREKGMKQMGIM